MDRGLATQENLVGVRKEAKGGLCICYSRLRVRKNYLDINLKPPSTKNFYSFNSKSINYFSGLLGCLTLCKHELQ